MLEQFVKILEVMDSKVLVFGWKTWKLVNPLTLALKPFHSKIIFVLYPSLANLMFNPLSL